MCVSFCFHLFFCRAKHDLGFIDKHGAKSPWSLTDPSIGNRWRQLAKGHRVISMPIWLYCDDTSGNVSKKWNKHISFLFTLAGLPHTSSQLEFHVHFLATSNQAAPLEILEAIVDQIK